MTAAKNMAKYYENARTHLLAQKPQATQNEINNNPYGREASELAHEVAKLAESWDYDGLDDEGNDWENNYPFQLEVPPDLDDNNCMMNMKDEQIESHMELVRDRLEDMYWTLDRDLELTEFQKDKLDEATLGYRLEIRRILKEDQA